MVRINISILVNITSQFCLQFYRQSTELREYREFREAAPAVPCLPYQIVQNSSPVTITDLQDIK